MIEDGAIRDGYATAEEGLAMLLNAEGGCVDLVTAGSFSNDPAGSPDRRFGEKSRTAN